MNNSQNKQLNLTKKTLNKGLINKTSKGFIAIMSVLVITFIGTILAVSSFQNKLIKRQLMSSERQDIQKEYKYLSCINDIKFKLMANLPDYVLACSKGTSGYPLLLNSLCQHNGGYNQCNRGGEDIRHQFYTSPPPGAFLDDSAPDICNINEERNKLIFDDQALCSVSVTLNNEAEASPVLISKHPLLTNSDNTINKLIYKSDQDSLYGDSYVYTKEFMNDLFCSKLGEPAGCTDLLKPQNFYNKINELFFDITVQVYKDKCTKGGENCIEGEKDYCMYFSFLEDEEGKKQAGKVKVNYINGACISE